MTALAIKLTEGEQARMPSKEFKSLDVFLKYLEAESLLRKGTKQSIIRLGQVAQEIVDMAPEYSAGYSMLGWYNWSLAVYGQSPRESLAKAFELAQKALSLDAYSIF